MDILKLFVGCWTATYQLCYGLRKPTEKVDRVIGV